MMSQRVGKIFDWVFGFLFVAAAIALVVFTISLANNIGYKDGYCSALGGSTIGDSRVCNVDGRVVEIPSP